jgi:His-Xaa-Ser system radical SAM maturase HxsB
MTQYATVALPMLSRRLGSGANVVVSETGDHILMSDEELRLVRSEPESLSLERLAQLRARFLVATEARQPGLRRLARSRTAARRETVESGPSLHIIVPTLQCAHSCRYCQVSRALDDCGHAMSEDHIDAACDTVLQSEAKTLTIEFQGGDPLLRFDLIRRAVLRIQAANATANRRLRFVVASTLQQLNDEMCDFFAEHRVFLSTSIDGPRELHNRNRPIPSRDAHERTVAGIQRARHRLGHDAVSALMTTTRESLMQPEAIVDEYVRLGFRDIFLRPLSVYGFAMRNQAHLGYTLESFFEFYRRGLDRVIHWNRQGVELREVYASVLLNKILSPFDGGYVDLQSPTGAGSSVLVYNYDGYVYPSDEGRMLLETGDRSLRLGKIGTSLADLLRSPVRATLIQASLVDQTPGCDECAYNKFCAPNPVDAQAQFGTPFAPVLGTDHCKRHLALFDTMFAMLESADEWALDLFHRWALPTGGTA